jgi:nitronate monooxygenase
VAFNTRVTELLGIRHPILLAPMGSVSGGRLAAAVTRAGGLGFLGPGYSGLDWIARELDAAENERVGIGFIAWDLAREPARLVAALARKPVAVMLSFGDPSPFADDIRRAGARLVIQVQTVAAAKQAVALGADVIVAQGTEAGGHGATRALFPLLPAVVDVAGTIPVIAAGGVTDGRGLAAALALGASGAMVGTAFYVAAESLGAAAAKSRIVAASGDDTLRTTTFDVVRGLDWPSGFTGRALRNRFTDRWHGHEAALAADVEQPPLYARAAAVGDLDTAVVWAGEGVDQVGAERPAADIVADLVRGAEKALSRAASLVEPTTRSPPR